MEATDIGSTTLEVRGGNPVVGQNGLVEILVPKPVGQVGELHRMDA